MEQQTAALGTDHDGRLYTATTLGRALSELGRHGPAVPLLRDTHARLARTVGAEHLHTLRAASALGQALVAARGRTRGGQAAAAAEGAALLRATHATLAALFPDHVETQRTAERLRGAGVPLPACVVLL